MVVIEGTQESADTNIGSNETYSGKGYGLCEKLLAKAGVGDHFWNKSISDTGFGGSDLDRAIKNPGRSMCRGCRIGSGGRI
jgi:hypothetical protein